MIFYKHEITNSNLVGFADANFNVETKGLSRSGILAYLFNCPIGWSSKLQSVPALSTAEAEWYAIDYLIKKLLWTIKIINEISLKLSTTPIYCDNQPTIKILNSEFISTRTKHIDRTFI